MGKRWRNSSGQRIRLESGARMRDDADCCCGGDPCEGVDLSELAGSFVVEGVIETGGFRYIDVTAPPPPAGFAYCGGETWSAQAPCGTGTSATEQSSVTTHGSCGDPSPFFANKVRVLVGSAATFYVQLMMTLVETSTGDDCTAFGVWCMGTIGCDNATILDQGVVGVDTPNCANASNGYNFGIEIPDTLTMEVTLDLIAEHTPVPSDECEHSWCDGARISSPLSVVMSKTDDTAGYVRYEGFYEETAYCLEFDGGYSLQPQSFNFQLECTVSMTASGGTCFVQAAVGVNREPSVSHPESVSGPAVSNYGTVAFPPLQQSGSTYTLDDHLYPPCPGSGMEWGYNPPSKNYAYYNGVITASFVL